MRIGDTADNFTFVRADGSSVPLAAFSGKALVLIFLRHLA
jgi:peroxiredoxin